MEKPEGTPSFSGRQGRRGEIGLALISLGCPKNLVDSEVLMGQLDGKFQVVHDSNDPSDILVINTCGFINDAKEESVDTILRAIEAKKEEWFRQGVSSLKSGKYDVAIRAFSQAIELSPKYAEAYVNRALAYVFLGMDDDAQYDIERALELGIDRAALEAQIEFIKMMR